MGRTFIIPLAEENFDFYKAAIPEKMRNHNAITYAKEQNIDIIASKIIHKMNED